MHNKTGAILEVTAVVCMSNEGAVSGEIVTVATLAHYHPSVISIYFMRVA